MSSSLAQGTAAGAPRYTLLEKMAQAAAVDASGAERVFDFGGVPSETRDCKDDAADAPRRHTWLEKMATAATVDASGAERVFDFGGGCMPSETRDCKDDAARLAKAIANNDVELNKDFPALASVVIRMRELQMEMLKAVHAEEAATKLRLAALEMHVTSRVASRLAALETHVATLTDVVNSVLKQSTVPIYDDDGKPVVIDGLRQAYASVHPFGAVGTQ
jgi:hypothetical protein